MSIWLDYGFSQSPYATRPVPATEEGARLLVGRDSELRRLTARLTSSALHPTLEGENGVGKTSLVSVAGYMLQTKFEARETGQALLPLQRTFQLSPGSTVPELTRDVLYAIAGSMIHYHDLLKRRGFNVPNVADVDRWLNAPVFGSREVGGQAAGFGMNVGRGREPNASAGFTEAGFAATVVRWLKECFPTPQAGGFICVVDNLELLETSAATRALLEGMRDTALDLPGLRWVLCGARGIVRGGAASPRLEGRLAEPLELPPVRDEDVATLIERRVDLYRIRTDAIAPVEAEGFRHIYDLLNQNLRNALKFCEDFAFWLHEEQEPVSSGSNSQLLQVWLADQADRACRGTNLGQRAWLVFDQMSALGGTCSPSDFESFDFNSSMAMRPHVKALEDANLVQSSIDDTDKRRKTIAITPRGWLVQYQRSGYRLPNFDTL
jgi:hypothetical protein